MRFENKGLSVFTVGYLMLAAMLFYAGVDALNNEWYGTFVMDPNVYWIIMMVMNVIILWFSYDALNKSFMVQGTILGQYAIVFLVTALCGYFAGTTDGVQPLYFVLGVGAIGCAVMAFRARTLLPMILSVMFLFISIPYYFDVNSVYMIMLFAAGIVSAMYAMFNWMHFQDLTRMTDQEIMDHLVK